MAHMIETMAYAGEVPWHGLGKQVPHDLSPEQMLKAAGLDWTVSKHRAYAEVNGQRRYSGQDLLVRDSDSRTLSVVTDDWVPMQNVDAFKFFQEYCEAGDMQMHTAGSLRDGQIVWALAKINESFELFDGDVVDSYMLLTNPHKFGQCIDVRFTPIRVVCNNTLTLSLNQKTDRFVKKNHRREFNAADVKQDLGIATEKLSKYKEMAEFLGSKRWTNESLKQYFSDVFPVLAYDKEKGPQRKELSKSATRALEVIDTQPGAKFAEGSWWSAFNAVTYLVDHEIGKTRDNRLTSAWFGPNKTLKTSALEKAVDYASAA